VIDKPRPGGSIVGTNEAAKAAPDGYTLLLILDGLPDEHRVQPPSRLLTAQRERAAFAAHSFADQ
jgi:hypothetical protein